MVETEIAAPPTTARTVLAPLTQTSGTERMFPTLTAAQIERIAAHGHVRPIRPGEVLIEAGRTRSCRSSSSRQVRWRLSCHPVPRETLIAVHGPGQFTGEVNMLSGRPALVRTRAMRAGRSDRTGSRTLVGARADRQRDRRDHHAGLHHSQGGVDRARARRCRARRVESLLRNASRQRVSDAQRPSVLVHRSRP